MCENNSSCGLLSHSAYRKNISRLVDISFFLLQLLSESDQSPFLSASSATDANYRKAPPREREVSAISRPKSSTTAT